MSTAVGKANRHASRKVQVSWAYEEFCTVIVPLSHETSTSALWTNSEQTRKFCQQNCVLFFSLLKLNHFQRLSEVNELKVLLFAQCANTRKQASNRRPLPCNAMAPTVQNRWDPWCPDRTRRRCWQQTSSYITAHPWRPGLIVGHCPSERACAVQLVTRNLLLQSSTARTPIEN